MSGMDAGGVLHAVMEAFSVARRQGTALDTVTVDYHGQTFPIPATQTPYITVTQLQAVQSNTTSGR